MAPDGDGVEDVVAIGRPAEGGPRQLFSYRIADGKRLSDVPLAFNGTDSDSVTPVVADFRGIGRKDVALNTWDDRSIVMVDGRSGATLWRFQTGQPNMGGLSAGDLDGDGQPDIIASSGDGNLYGLRGRDGNVLWKAQMEPGFQGNGLANPILVDLRDGSGPSVLAISGAGRLYIVNARTGVVVWRSEVQGGSGVVGRPVIVEREQRKIILAPQSSAGLIAYDAVSRRELWRSPAGQLALSTPVAVAWGRTAQAAVLFVSGSGSGYLLDIVDGTVMWQDRISGGVEADPVVVDVNADGYADIVVAGHEDKTLHALNGLGNLGAPWGQAR
jgi:outer membrane protein assembly factor BamB